MTSYCLPVFNHHSSRSLPARWSRAWQGLLASILLLCCLGAVEVPKQVQPVTDLTGSLTAGQQQQLSEALLGLEQRKGSQLAVLIVPSTGEESIEQYSMRVVEQWRLGRKDVDDGVLLLLAKDDRKLRIEVGYGLEGALSDAVARRITSETMVPRLREGDLHAAIADGVAQIIQVIEGEPLPEPAADDVGDMAGIGFEPVVFMLMISVLLRLGIGRHLPGALSGLLCAVVTAGIIWLILGELMPTLAAALIGLIVGAVRTSGRRAAGRKARSDGADCSGTSASTSFSSSSAGSGSSSSSSSSSSSYSSSSGGDFGGGGSSDSW